MTTVSAKDLRRRTAAVLKQVLRGRRVVITYRGRSVAALVPIAAHHEAGLSLAGFGMWRTRRDMRNVPKWLSDRRTPRFSR